MIKAIFDETKAEYIRHVKEMFMESGGLMPTVTILADSLEEELKDKPSIIHIPVPERFMNDDDGKDEFIDRVIPEISQDLNKRFKPVAVGWASEAWLRVGDVDTDISKYKDLPIKKEVLIITIEAEGEHTEVYLFDIKRGGKEVNKDGELVDIISLEPDTEMKTSSEMLGRFSGLLEKFTKK